ncbi:NeuD/PglB/VioB family sugar acetyltransferase [Chryseobacterium wangxinyae]|uniref:NeuD/PglB/VioB family sugar acetyltransferase n=1 Tax=Chryseobacterium sp. CY353 TaxID=2997334 RepID=UPI00226DDED0|nr:NeuD/PglB/VioB family sugar acetyltransferase [Chryseobacterium sp. CY353]MCY0970995.1 NeuD/PglB/VioB family sugar acetyltransferase [Chryseobacterium sp. CY353]
MNIVLIGGGTQVSYSIDIIEKQNLHKIVGVIDSNRDIGENLYNYNVIGRQNEIRELITKYNIEGCVITIGDNWSRKKVFDEISDVVPDILWPNIIHPSVIIANNVNLGKGILAMAGVIINSNAHLGDFTNYFTNCNVEHDCYIDDFASISAGAVLGGKVRVGKYSAIALNATVFDRLSIGDNSVVGAASLVTKNLPDDVLAYGNPAQIIRNREKGEKFLK